MGRTKNFALYSGEAVIPLRCADVAQYYSGTATTKPYRYPLKKMLPGSYNSIQDMAKTSKNHCTVMRKIAILGVPCRELCCFTRNADVMRTVKYATASPLPKLFFDLFFCTTYLLCCNHMILLRKVGQQRYCRSTIYLPKNKKFAIIDKNILMADVVKW